MKTVGDLRRRRGGSAHHETREWVPISAIASRRATSYEGSIQRSRYKLAPTEHNRTERKRAPQTANMSPRTFGRRRSSSTSSLNRPLVLAFSIGAFLAALSHVTPVSGFLPPASSPMSSSSRAAKHAEQRVSPLFGIKRKVKAEMESNFSGKVVEPANAETSMFGSDANALFDVIEKNKKKAAEAAAAAAALSAGDGDEGEEEGEGAEAGEGASDAEESGEAA